MNIKGRYAFNGLEHVIWGQDAISACVAEAERRSAERVAIITSPSLRRVAGTVDSLAGSLGEKSVAIFDELLPHTPAPQVAAFAQLLKDKAADLVISLGGGTPIDTAKVALAMLDADASDPFAVANKVPKSTPPKIRQIACPTTLSGAEFSDLAGLTDPDTKIKHGVASFGIGPATVILDPELARHTPLDLWLSTGMRAVDHAIETLCSIEATPYTDALAAEALSKLVIALRQTKHDPANLQARLDAQMAVWLASAGLDRTPYGASHGIGHQLGAVSGTPHGICSCVLLPAVLEWNAKHARLAQQRISDILEADSAANGVRRLLRDLELPARLSEADIQHNDLPEIAAGSVNNRWVKTNPRPLTTAKDIEKLLEAAF